MERDLRQRNGRHFTHDLILGFLSVIDDDISQQLRAPSVVRQPRSRDERVSVIELAKDVLGDDLSYEEAGELRLRENDGWKPGTRLWHVMIAANRILKARGGQQILHNPAWEVV